MSLAVAATMQPAAGFALRLYRPSPSEVVEGQLKLARKAARRYSRGGEPDADLCQEAALAILRATDRLDPFDPRTPRRIERAARKAARRAATATAAGVVTLSRVGVADRRRVRESRERLHAALRRVPTAREVCDDLRATGPKRRDLTRLGALIDAPANRCDPATLGHGDGRADERRHAEREAVGLALSRLSPRQREAVTLRYGLAGSAPLGVPGVAGAMGIGTDMARGHLVRGLRQLRTILDGQR